MTQHIHNPAMLAANVYLHEWSARSFEEDLDIHLLTGFVVSTPEYFIMARLVVHDAPEEQITDPLYVFPPDEVDCWHIWLAAGDFTQFWNEDKHDCQWVSWQKRNKLKVYRMETIKRKML